MEPVTVVAVLVLATWTCANFFASRRIAPRIYAAEKLRRLADKTRVACDELMESLRRRQTLLDEKEDILDKKRAADEEHYQKLKVINDAFVGKMEEIVQASMREAIALAFADPRALNAAADTIVATASQAPWKTAPQWAKTIFDAAAKALLGERA